MSSSTIDARSFRNALGNFATGVTVITTKDPATGQFVGVTANSFNSVSLEPPLVLWSIARTARSLQAFSGAEYFAVNVLSADQVSVSNHFASKVEDKFAELDYELGCGDSPLLAGCAARFQCRKAFEYDGGDHIILVGEVVGFDDSGRAGLLYHRGAYAVCEPHPATAKVSEEAASTGFVAHYLDYLLATAANRFEMNFQPVLDRIGLSQNGWRVLATLSDQGELTVPQLSTTVLVPEQALEPVAEAMVTEGLLEDAGDGRLRLAPAGQEKLDSLLAAARAHEADALGEFSEAEASALKSMLKRLINWVDTAGTPGVAARKATGG